MQIEDTYWAPRADAAEGWTGSPPLCCRSTKTEHSRCISFRITCGQQDAAGLGNAVNMDTGYVNYLGDEEQLQVRNGREKLSAGT